MHPRRAAFSLVILVAMLAIAVPGGAVTYGDRDVHGAHPSVGLALFPASGQLCSGTLVAERVFVTAAHCTAGSEQALVSFAPDAGASQEHFVDTAQPGAAATHERWADFAEYPATFDLGVVVLDEAVELEGGYPEIVGEGYLDRAVASGRGPVELTVVGYGDQGVQLTGPPWDPDSRHESWDGHRHVGSVRLVTLDSIHTGGFNLQHSGNPGHGGGTCYGDSGGPVLHEGKLVAVSSFFRGNTMCRGNTGFAHRVDIPSSQEFLRAYGVTE